MIAYLGKAAERRDDKREERDLCKEQTNRNKRRIKGLMMKKEQWKIRRDNIDACRDGFKRSTWMKDEKNARKQENERCKNELEKRRFKRKM